MVEPYATADEVRHLLTPDPERRQGSAATLDDDTLAERIATASAEVDSALAAGGYTVPVAQCPPLVRDVVLAIAGWLADLTYRRGKAHESDRDPVVARYLWAQNLLKGWASGRRKVPGLPEADASTGGGEISAVINPPGVCLTGTLIGDGPVYELPNDYDPDWYRWAQGRGWW